MTTTRSSSLKAAIITAVCTAIVVATCTWYAALAHLRKIPTSADKHQTVAQNPADKQTKIACLKEIEELTLQVMSDLYRERVLRMEDDLKSAKSVTDPALDDARVETLATSYRNSKRLLIRLDTADLIFGPGKTTHSAEQLRERIRRLSWSPSYQDESIIAKMKEEISKGGSGKEAQAEASHLVREKNLEGAIESALSELVRYGTGDITGQEVE